MAFSMCRSAPSWTTGTRLTTGELGEMPRILKPMEPFKKDMLLLGNLTHNGGRALLDGGGDHARATGG